MKCFIVSNCTHSPIKEYLAATGLFSKLDSCAIFTIKPEDLEAKYAEIRSGYDLVFSAVLYGDKWGPFEHAALKADLGDRAILFDAPFFEGLHPDLIHVSQNDERFKSPIGDYHSGLIFWGYMTGRKISDLVDMYEAGEMPDFFNAKTIWDRAVQVLTEREALADVRIAADIADLCRQKPAMLTFNHPTMDVVAALCDGFTKLTFGPRNLPVMMTGNIHNILLSDVIIPVSPAAIKAQDLPYQTTALYKFGLAAPNHEKGYLAFDRFARMSYARYGCVDRATLRATTPGRSTAALMKAIETPQEAA
ncbi:WcbI family polysaccharide biosynthesis putative acetyltransferase [Cypionkella sp.]|uniref:WcbI family polysaccharide biosynthesis putative acetyltransferase n=1 Tax=Cypionkella sp. TaxID=2811411 RepID=UPI002ABCB827|nr:WcbI family polysaccharide biosynthesis putative acetyltransferase [Cypionkella sp.]MDZ4393517.1 WcbI family polysaccharide biosynthesis putative acetyltransferase [Cypionkella sp.]